MKAKKILLVEDDNISREAYQHFLDKAGYLVYPVSNGPDAVVYSQKERFDLVILDIIVPGFDGFHVLAKIKENPKTSLVPVMMLTNLDDNKYIKRATSLGAMEYLIKVNTSPSQVVEHVKSLIG